MTRAFRVFLLLIFLSCSSSFQHAAPFTYELKNAEQFELMQGAPLTLKYGGVTAVKVVLDLQANKLYFLDSKLYRFHFEFCVDQLAEMQSLADFNHYNYSPSDRRKYVFATVNHYPNQQLYTLEFASTEELSKDDIMCYTEVVNHSFIGNKLKFFISTNRQMEQFEQLHSTVPTISVDDVYKGLVYQPIVQQTCYGYLRKIDVNELSHRVVHPDDILLLNGSPLDIPVCSGIITASFQAPLSHICILCQNRMTPLMAYKGAWQDARINQWLNQPVCLTILQDTFFITSSSAKQIELQHKKKKIRPIQLRQNLSVDSLVAVSRLQYGSIDFAGGKASNMGELFKVKVPEYGSLHLPERPFVIPFYFYVEQLNRGNAANLIAQLLVDTVTLSNDTLLKKALKKIRKEILETTVSPALLKQITTRLRTYPTGTRFRFRSSTNAEDIEGFNGAGLYDSKSASLTDSIQTIEKAIKKVWASVWNERAFKERSYFQLDQHKIAMAILVHPAFGTEEINAVGITKNLYRSDYPGYTVNLQLGEVPVVNSPDSVNFEQLLLHYSDFDPQHPHIIADYLSMSSLSNNKPLLNETQLKELYETLDAIKMHYYYHVKNIHPDSFQTFAMDIEMKWIGPSKKLFVKQARVYSR